MILSYQDSTNNWLWDTTWLKNGKFTFKGFIDQPTLANLGDPKDINGGTINTVLLFIEPTEMTVQLIEGDYDKADLKGSDVQAEYKLFLKEKNKVDLKWEATSKEYDKLRAINNSKDEDFIEKTSIKLNQITPKITLRDQEIEFLKYNYIRDFPHSYVSAYFLATFSKRPPLEYQKASFKKINNNLKKFRYGKLLKDEIEKRILVDIGAAAPEFSGSNPEGKIVKLSDLKGKFVLIDFWASWCVPCREGFPDLKKYYDQYNSKGFRSLPYPSTEENPIGKKLF